MRWLSTGEIAAPQLDGALSVSPVCGWVLFNHLDMTLDIFARGRESTGRPRFAGADPLDRCAGPRRPNGARTALAIPAVPCKKPIASCSPLSKPPRDGAGYLRALTEAIDLQMQGINPLGIRQDQGLARLIGAPLALVRTSLRREVSGLTPLDQKSAALAQLADDYQKLLDSTDPDQLSGSYGDFTRRAEIGLSSVQVPVRLGDLGLLEDGLVGYFLSDPASPADVDFSRFFASALAPVHAGAGLGEPDPKVSAPPDLVLLPVSSLTTAPDRVVAMLIDPRGAVHATTGVLPVGEMRLPPDSTASALRRIAVSFPTAPVIAAAGDKALPQAPVPDERGWGWEWLVPAPSKDGLPGVAESWGKFAARRSLLTQPSELQILEGWLRLSQP